MPAIPSYRRAAVAVATLAPLVACAVEAPSPGPDGPSPAAVPARDGAPFEDVVLTWLSVTGWLLEAGPTSVVLDGYVGRVDRSTMYRDGSSGAPARPDDRMVRRVREALLSGGGPDWVLVGHTHWDHALDAAAWALQGGGRLLGSRTACLQAEAFGMATERCTVGRDGQRVQLGPGLHARVIRWHHSGDSASLGGRVLRAPLALPGIPGLVDGGLRPGFLEDFPGGGARAYLFVAETTGGPVRILWSNTGNPQLWDAPARADSTYFREHRVPAGDLVWEPADRSTRASVVAAREAEGIDRVDAWLGFGDVSHVRQVFGELPARAFVPHHWDDFWAAIEEGVSRPFESAPLRDFLEAEGIALLPPGQFFDRLAVTVDGVRAIGDGGVRSSLGVPSSR